MWKEPDNNLYPNPWKNSSKTDKIFPNTMDYENLTELYTSSLSF